MAIQTKTAAARTTNDSSIGRPKPLIDQRELSIERLELFGDRQKLSIERRKLFGDPQGRRGS
jgi:hypothetical protein